MLTGTADISEIDDPQSATPPPAPKTQTATVDDIDTESVKDPKELVRRYAPQYGIDPDLAEKLADRESIHFRPDVVSGKTLSPRGAIGTMQLMPDTAKGLGVNPYDLHDNIRGGLQYLKKQMDDFGDQRLALAAYNAGPQAVIDHKGIPPYKETRDYVDAIAGPVQKGTATVDDIDSQAPTSGTATVDQIGTEAPTVNVGAPGRPLTSALPPTAPAPAGPHFNAQNPINPMAAVNRQQQGTAAQIQRGLQNPPQVDPAYTAALTKAASDKTAMMQEYNDKVQRLNDVGGQDDPGLKTDVEALRKQIQMTPAQMVAQQQQFDQLGKDRALALSTALDRVKNDPKHKEQAIIELGRYGPVSPEEAAQLGISQSNIHNAMMSVAKSGTEFLGSVARAAKHIPQLEGISSEDPDKNIYGQAESTLQDADKQLQAQRNVYGKEGVVGQVVSGVGEMIPDLVLAGLTGGESLPAQAATFGGITGAKAFGRGEGPEGVIKSAAFGAGGVLTGHLIRMIAPEFAESVLGQMGIRGTGNAILGGLWTAADGGDTKAIASSAILFGAQGLFGGGHPEKAADLLQSPDLQEAVIEHAKNPSAETFDNVAKTAEKAGLDAYEAQKFATNVDNLKSASSTTPEVTSGVTRENTTTPISPIERDENGLPVRKIAPIPERPIGETPAVESPARATPDGDLQKPAPVVAPIDEQNQGQTASVKAFITKADEAALKSRGYSDDDIYKMKPADAQKILESPPSKVGQPVTHSDESINGKPIVAETTDGKVVVPNETNKSGVSVVKDQAPEEFGASNKKFTKSGVDQALDLIRQKQLERSKANEPTESSQVNPDVAERFKPLETEVVKTDSVLGPKIDAAIDDPSPANTKALHDAASAQLESVISDPVVREQHATAIVDAATEESKAGRTEERGIESEQGPAGDKLGPEPVGIKNKITDAELEAQGKPKIDTSAQKRGFDEVIDNGKKLVDNGQIDPAKLADQIANGKPHALDAEETAALLYHKTRLLNQEDSIMKELRGHRETGDVDKEIDARGRLKEVQESLDTARKASRKSGYEQGLGLAIRRAMMERDYSLSRLTDRWEAAQGGKPLTAADKIDIQKLRDSILKREEQAADYDERQSKGEASKTITELRKEATAERKAGRRQTKTALDGEFASQKAALAKLFSKDAGPSKPIDGSYSSERGAVDPEMMRMPKEVLKLIRDMAKNRLEAGITTVDGVVDAIHEVVVDFKDGVTKRQIRDLISGYGKTSKPNPEALAVAMRELTAGMRDISAEEDILGGKAPERSGYQRGPMTPEARARRQRINQLMREHGIEIERSGRSPEEQQKSALDGVKTRLKNAIDDLQRQIDTGEKPSKRTPVPRDEEAKALQAKRDDLARTLQDINGPRKMTDAQRLDMAKGAAKKAIDEYQRRIDQKDFATKQSGKVSDPELDALKAKRDALKTDYQKLADADPAVQIKRDAAKLDQLKTRMQKRLDSLKQQVATGNFYRNAQGKLTTSKPRVPFAGLDPEAQEIKANVEKAQSAADAKIKAIELANRSAPEKIMDFAAKIRRFIVLSSGTAVEKLTAAGATRQISDPIESAIGGAISKTPGLRDIAAKAPREGAFKPSVEAQASALYIKKMLDLSRFKETLKTGKGKLDLIHGGKEYFDSDSKTDRILGFYNRLHAALKEPVKEAEFFRSTQYRTDQAIRQGLDITDAKVRDSIAAQAYLDANRKVFMNPNFVTDAYQKGIQSLEHYEGKGAGAAKATALLGKIFFPVVRVPTNYLFEVSSYSPAGFAKAAPDLYKAVRHGVDSLSAEDADYVMRNLKKGLIGSAMMGLGAALSNNMGGFYTQRNYSTPEDMKAGEVKIAGINIPRLFLHHPLIEAMQFGATWSHLHGKQESLARSFAGTSMALAEEQPFIGETLRNADALREKGKFEPAAGQLVGGLVTPPDLRRIANILDPKTPTSVMMKLLQTGGLQSADPMYRPPKTFAQGFESGIPSFIPYVNRKNIPSKLIPPSRPVRPEKPAR